MTKIPRTDLAMEAKSLWEASAGTQTSLAGVKAEERSPRKIPVTTVEILDEEGASALCKPTGRYVTLALDAFTNREAEGFARCAAVLGEELQALLPFRDDRPVLVVGLGNAAITPDAIGPKTIDHLLVTRHLKETLPEDFRAFRTVSAIKTGVLGTTGMESADLIAAVVKTLAPGCVIAVDALASCHTERLCRTVQLSDAGIAPGSGVGNGRRELSHRTLGVPVLAVGVPTVTDAETLVLAFSQQAGLPGEEIPLPETAQTLMVTPRDIDAAVSDLSRLLGYGINLALHQGLTLSDLDMLVG